MIFKRHIIFIVFLLFFGGVLFYKLVTYPQPLFDWDESLYVQNGLEMLAQQKFLVPVWQGQAWLDKPPLTPLLLGLVAKFMPLPVEISTRLYTLFLSLLALILIYRLYLKASKSRLSALFTVVVTAFAPIFLQRAQVVSLDVTLLVGWLGFFLFLEKPYFSTLFLLLGVQSKSLLGFYPLIIYGFYLGYQYFTAKIKLKALFDQAKIMLLQILFLSLWYFAALAIYKEHFFQAHIIESHFRRVSASLESHFGQRTFYLDLMKEQLNWLSLFSVIGASASLYAFWQKKISPKMFLLQNAFLPWFLFLNLTKTKIAWYLYPVIPQFAFYSGYSLSLLKNKFLKIVVFGFLISLVVYQGVVRQNLMGTFYSHEDTHIKAAKFARTRCANLAVLVPDYTRETYQTLKQMNLTIGTTSWWGEHPSMVYYFGKPLKFYYSTAAFANNIKDSECFIIDPQDQNIMEKNHQIIKAFDKMLLYRQ